MLRSLADVSAPCAEAPRPLDGAGLCVDCVSAVGSRLSLPLRQGVGAGLHGERDAGPGAVAFEDGHDHFQGCRGLAGAGDRFAAALDALDYVNRCMSIEGVQQLGIAGGPAVRVGEVGYVDRFPGER